MTDPETRGEAWAYVYLGLFGRPDEERGHELANE